MWNYDKGNQLLLRMFDQECKELCYSQCIPEKVAEVRKLIEKCRKSEDAEAAKNKAMFILRKNFDPDLYDWDKITIYDEQGELKGA